MNLDDLTVIIGSSLFSLFTVGIGGFIAWHLLRKRTEVYISAFISTYINSFMQSATENPEQFKPAIMAVGNMALNELQKQIGEGQKGGNGGGGSLLGGILPGKYKRFGPLLEALLPRLIPGQAAQQAAETVSWG